MTSEGMRVYDERTVLVLLHFDWIVKLIYLSLVVLYIEEGVIVRQFDHLQGMICGFMNDGQVEKPVG